MECYIIHNFVRFLMEIRAGSGLKLTTSCSFENCITNGMSLLDTVNRRTRRFVFGGSSSHKPHFFSTPWKMKRFKSKNKLQWFATLPGSTRQVKIPQKKIQSLSDWTNLRANLPRMRNCFRSLGIAYEKADDEFQLDLLERPIVRRSKT